MSQAEKMNNKGILFHSRATMPMEPSDERDTNGRRNMEIIMIQEGQWLKNCTVAGVSKRTYEDLSNIDMRCNGLCCLR